jgi:uncharacterized protein (TIGR00252 family)
MSSTSVGRKAESIVAAYFKRQGYTLIAQNWRTKACEIDLVLAKKGTVYFVEVKYRSSGAQGSGLEYITNKKLIQMRFAAEVWIATNKWDGNALIAAVEVSPGQTEFELVELF